MKTLRKVVKSIILSVNTAVCDLTQKIGKFLEGVDDVIDFDDEKPLLEGYVVAFRPGETDQRIFVGIVPFDAIGSDISTFLNFKTPYNVDDFDECYVENDLLFILAEDVGNFLQRVSDGSYSVRNLANEYHLLTKSSGLVPDDLKEKYPDGAQTIASHLAQASAETPAELHVV